MKKWIAFKNGEELETFNTREEAYEKLIHLYWVRDIVRIRTDVIFIILDDDSDITLLNLEEE